MVAELENEHVGQRLKRFMRGVEPPLTVENVAEACGVSVQAVYKWFDTGKVARKHLPVLAELLNLQMNALFSDDSAAENSTLADKYEFVTRVRGAVLSAGKGKTVWEHEEIDNSHAFTRAWLQRKHLSPKNCRIITVDGDSMAPELRSGYVVLIDTADRDVRSGKIYALIYDGETLIKRLFRLPDGSLEIRSDNPLPEYRAITVRPQDLERVNIIGRKRWHSGDDD
jgi:phage repressor protein C with HTH and peptisase S24 domain